MLNVFFMVSNLAREQVANPLQGTETNTPDTHTHIANSLHVSGLLEETPTGTVRTCKLYTEAWDLNPGHFVLGRHC